jgi:hypothetical protein
VPVGATRSANTLASPGPTWPESCLPAAVAAHHLRVDRIHLVAGRQQRPDQQPPVGLDPHRHLCWLLGMGGHQRVQLAHARRPIGDPPGGQHGSVLIQQAQVMVAFAPVHPKKPTRRPPLLRRLDVEPEKDPRRPNGSVRSLAWRTPGIQSPHLHPTTALVTGLAGHLRQAGGCCPFAAPAAALEGHQVGVATSAKRPLDQLWVPGLRPSRQTRLITRRLLLGVLRGGSWLVSPDLPDQLGGCPDHRCRPASTAPTHSQMSPSTPQCSSSVAVPGSVERYAAAGAHAFLAAYGRHRPSGTRTS